MSNECSRDWKHVKVSFSYDTSTRPMSSSKASPKGNACATGWKIDNVTASKEINYLMKTFNITEPDIDEYRILYMFALNSKGVIEANEVCRVKY